MKVRELIKQLLDNGFVLARHGKGDHNVYKNEATGKTVSIDGQPGKDIPKGTLSRYLRDAGLKEGK